MPATRASPLIACSRSKADRRVPRCREADRLAIGTDQATLIECHTSRYTSHWKLQTALSRGPACHTALTHGVLFNRCGVARCR
jgi:hypothetical protein